MSRLGTVIVRRGKMCYRRERDRQNGSFLVGRGISEEVKAVKSRLRWVTFLGLGCYRTHA